MKKDQTDETKSRRRDDCFRPGLHERFSLVVGIANLASMISDISLLIPVCGTLVVDKEIDLLNARREIRVRIPG